MKVGKAIYNILSQSTEVQSNFPFNTTDYSPTGTELVTNGDFSAGVEQLTQPIDLTVDFVVNSGGVIDDSNSFTTSGGAFDGIKNTTGAFPTGETLQVGKSYKLVIEGSTTSSGLSIGRLTMSGNEYGVGFGTHYFTLLEVGIWIRQQTAGTTDLTTFTIEELGEGWTGNTNGGFSINASGLSLDSSKIDTSGGGGGTVYSALTQVGTIIEIGKSYKLVIDNLDITSGNIELKFGLDHTTTPLRPVLTSADNGTYTDYFTAQTVNDGFTINSAGGTVATLSNISVEEMVLNKIFPELAPPDIDAPYVVYSVVSNSPSETKNTNGDIDTASIEVYGFQDTYNKAVDLGVSIRAALDRKTGTYNTIEIQSTNYVNEQMDVNEARKLWAAIQDYSIRIKNI